MLVLPLSTVEQGGPGYRVAKASAEGDAADSAGSKTALPSAYMADADVPCAGVTLAPTPHKFMQ